MFCATMATEIKTLLTMARIHNSQSANGDMVRAIETPCRANMRSSAAHKSHSVFPASANGIRKM